MNAINKQDLIKWMTEKRENFTFESKVKFLKDFWEKKERIKDLEQKEVEVEEIKQDLKVRWYFLWKKHKN